MSCPRCSSNDLWDDNLSWGCNKCGYAATPAGPTFLFAKNSPDLARSVDEMVKRGQILHRGDNLATRTFSESDFQNSLEDHDDEIGDDD